MTTVLLVIHILLALALIGVVLLQRSEGGGLGIGGGGGGGGGGMSGFLTGRGTANLLTRTTAILAAGFMLTSITLTILAGGGQPDSILDALPGEAPATSEGVPATPPAPAQPSEPSVPTQ
jgi:preprotein translocase subunit SecG